MDSKVIIENFWNVGVKGDTALREDETRIWDELFINGIHIGKVLEQSVIIDWD